MIRTTLLLIAALASGAATAASLLPQSPAAPATADEFLPVDDAFQLQPAEWRNGKLVVAWRIAPGYYLYRGRLRFEWLEPRDTKLGEPALPAGKPFHDEAFGAVEIYQGELAAQLSPAPARAGTLKVVYQGCADRGLCYPPQTRTLQVEAPR